MADDFGLNLGNTLSGSYYPGTQADFFPEPFLDMASLAMPQTMPSVLRWVEFLMNSQIVLRAAVGRNVSYFMTDIDITGEDLSDEEKKNIKEYANDELHIMDHAFWERMNGKCYGNSFVAVIESFTRYFVCRGELSDGHKCRMEFTFETFTSLSGFEHRWENFEMHGTCPRCKYRGPWETRDRRGGRDGDLLIKHYSPHEIQILWDDYSHHMAYVWMIPDDYKRKIIMGRPEALRYAPAEVIAACKANSYLRFADGYLFHGFERTFSGVRARGWGIPRLLTCFRQGWYVQMLHRFNEAIALTRTAPLQILTPDSRQGALPESSDPLLSYSMGNYGAQAEGMFRQHRQDPASMFWFPFPVKSQMVGGDAAQLAPFQLLDQGIDTLLNGLDIPVELYKMNLSAQSAQPALRLYESTQRDIPSNSNRFLQFVCQKICEYKDWPNCRMSLVPTSIIDDLSKQMPKLQLMGTGAVSPQTGLGMLDLDAVEELRKNLDFQRKTVELQQEVQKEMEQAGLQGQLTVPPLMQLLQGQQGGAPAGGAGSSGTGPAGAPAPGGPQTPGAQQFSAQSAMPNDIPVDPREITSRGAEIASQLRLLPEGQKDSRLRKLKQQNPALHAATRIALDDQRDQENRAAGDQMRGQKQAADHGIGDMGIMGLLEVIKHRG